MENTKKHLFKKERIPWNKGRTGLQKSYRKGKTWEDLWGKEKATEMKNSLRKKKYRGAISINKDGYYRKRNPKTGKYLLVHQEIWKENNLPYIPKGFCVHHLDGDSLNNNEKNLLLLDFSTHTKLHHLGTTHTKETKAKMSKSRKGVKFTEEHRINLKKALRISKMRRKM